MPSGWEVYYVVFLSALLALGIPALLGGVSLLIATRRPPRPGALPAGGDATIGQRVNTRFFLGANAALVLITLGLALIPCAGTLQQTESGEGSLFRGLISVITVAGFAALGLFYSSRKGDLHWLRSHRAAQDDWSVGIGDGGEPARGEQEG